MNTKHKFWIFGLSVLLLAGVSVQEKVKAQPGVSISFQTFYNDLSPYGRWSRNPQYGSVWVPNVDANFQPYSTNGYWEVTDYGNTWVSDYDWGWAPFHYGRWSFDDYTGWYWIPGYEWGPAWVSWRSGGDYYGWAPLGPGVNVNVSVNIPSFWWVFVPQRYITNRGWYNYCAPRGRSSYIYNQTTIVNNYYRNNNRTYVYGPRRDEIERVTRRSVPVRQIDASQRGRVIVNESDRYTRDARDYNNRGGNGGSNDAYNRNGRSNDNNGPARNNPEPNRGSYGSGNSRNNDYPDRSGGRISQPNVPDSRSGNNGGYSAPNADRSNSRGNYDPANTPDNRSYEPARPSAPAAEPRREAPVPNYGSDRSGRSSRSADNGNQNAGRSYEAPASRPAERSAPESRGNSRGSESRAPQNNSDGGSRSSSGRGDRSPR